MSHPFSSQEERDAFRESLPASDTFVVPTSEVRLLLDALDAAERRAAEAEGDTALLRQWGEAIAQCEGVITVEDPTPVYNARLACRGRARALALASGSGGNGGGKGGGE